MMITTHHYHKLLVPRYTLEVLSRNLGCYRWFFSYKFHFSFSFSYSSGGILVFVLTFLYVKYGRRHYLCGHVYCTYWYIPTKIANATQFAVRRVA